MKKYLKLLIIVFIVIIFLLILILFLFKDTKIISNDLKYLTENCQNINYFPKNQEEFKTANYDFCYYSQEKQSIDKDVFLKLEYDNAGTFEERLNYFLGKITYQQEINHLDSSYIDCFITPSKNSEKILSEYFVESNHVNKKGESFLNTDYNVITYNYEKKVIIFYYSIMPENIFYEYSSKYFEYFNFVPNKDSNFIVYET